MQPLPSISAGSKSDPRGRSPLHPSGSRRGARGASRGDGGRRSAAFCRRFREAPLLATGRARSGGRSRRRLLPFFRGRKRSTGRGGAGTLELPVRYCRMELRLDHCHVFVDGLVRSVILRSVRAGKPAAVVLQRRTESKFTVRDNAGLSRPHANGRPEVSINKAYSDSPFW